MAPRWSAGSAVRRDDQFTVAPDFIDPHDSDHLGGGVEASWHGPQRRVLVAASIAALAGALGAFALFTFADVPDGPDAPGQGLAAEPGAGALPDAGAGALLNSTAPAPSPLPSLPPLPSVPAPGERP